MIDSLRFKTGHTNLGLSRVAFMCGNANLIEEVVQTFNDGSDLLGQVAGVHGDRKAASSTIVVSMDHHQAGRCGRGM